MNKFDDSLDGSIAKQTKQESLLMKLNNKLDKIIDNAPDVPEQINLGLSSDEICLRVLQKKKRVYSAWLSEHIGIPEKTVGYALNRLKKAGLATSRYQMVPSRDGKNRKTHMYYLIEGNKKVKKNERRKKK